MAIILFIIGRIYSYQFNCNDIRNKKIFLNFLVHIWKLHQIFNILKKKGKLPGYVFLKLETTKDVVS